MDSNDIQGKIELKSFVLFKGGLHIKSILGSHIFTPNLEQA